MLYDDREIRKYLKFKRFLEKRGLLDDFIKMTNRELSKWFNGIDGGELEDELTQNEGTAIYDDVEINFTIGDFYFEIMAYAEITADITYWEDPGDYWHPAGDGYDVDNVNVKNISIDITVTDAETEDEILSLNYFPEIDKKSELCIF